MNWRVTEMTAKRIVIACIGLLLASCCTDQDQRLDKIEAAIERIEAQINAQFEVTQECPIHRERLQVGFADVVGHPGYVTPPETDPEYADRRKSQKIRLEWEQDLAEAELRMFPCAFAECRLSDMGDNPPNGKETVFFCESCRSTRVRWLAANAEPPDFR